MSNLLTCWYLVCLILRPKRWRWYVPPKHQSTFNGLQGVLSQKTELFITAAAKTWNPIYFLFLAIIFSKITCFIHKLISFWTALIIILSFFIWYFTTAEIDITAKNLPLYSRVYTLVPKRNNVLCFTLVFLKFAALGYCSISIVINYDSIKLNMQPPDFSILKQYIKMLHNNMIWSFYSSWSCFFYC
jgi:hypothetical protein